MKKFIPYLFLTAATLHTAFGSLPVMALSCTTHSQKTEISCEKGNNECEQQIKENRVN